MKPDWNAEARRLLKEYFGYEEFRPGQTELIGAVFEGQDALGIMPTGAGKSVCYQIPALALPGITLVVSPLISLMKDQVRALTTAGIRAAYLNSSLTFRQYMKALDNARQGLYKIIYVAPERLETEAFCDFARHADISLLAVDEAHCVSQWGHDFRPAYLNIAGFLETLPVRPRMAAFTATATPAVKEDIRNLLKLRDPKTVVTGFDRPNLFFAVEKPEDKREAALKFVAKHRAESGIIYCATRKNVEAVTRLLTEHGYSAARYHAGLDDEERMRNQDDFRFDRVKIMVATNAFGMGIDKQNVGYVLHYNMPKNLESYYQEAGRAGRDGSEATCLLLYGPGDVRTAQYFINAAASDPATDEATRRQQKRIEEEKLEQMRRYCMTGKCLRGYILEYFGETAPDRCGNCGSCRTLFSAMKALGVKPSRQEPLDRTLYEILRSIRGDYAKMYGIPPDLIFTDYTLQDMCRKLPATEAELLEVSGVTPARVQRFGRQFLKAISRHGNRRSGV